MGVETGDQQEIALKFVPYRFACLETRNSSGCLGKRKNMSPEEAGMALTKAETEFWASKPAKSCCAIVSNAAFRNSLPGRRLAC